MNYQQDDEKSLDMVQRWVMSTLLIVVGGAPAALLAVYSVRIADTEYSSAVGLWVMSCVIGLATAVGVLVIHRRSPFSPWLILGLVPSLIGAYYLFWNR